MCSVYFVGQRKLRKKEVMLCFLMKLTLHGRRTPRIGFKGKHKNVPHKSYKDTNHYQYDANESCEINFPNAHRVIIYFDYRYRGLKSFRTSPWDPKENLPSDYARIFQFKDFRRTKKRILKDLDDEGVMVCPSFV